MEIIFKSWKEVEERKIDEKNSTGLALGDGMGRKVGGGFWMGNTCAPVADSW